MNTDTSLHSLPVRHKNQPSCIPAVAPRLTPGETQAIVSKLRAIADPTRLRILDLLAQQAEPLCVCEITDQFAQNQPTISHHLKLLRTAHLIDCEKRGIWAFYWATDEGRQSLAALATLIG